MKFVVIGDLHGNAPVIKYEDYDAIIAPGDFCSDAARKFMFEALMKRIKDPTCKTKWYDIVGRDKAEEMVKKSLADGRVILEDLNALGKPIYLVPGNWDWTADESEDWDFLHEDHFATLIDGLNNVVDVHHRIVDVGDFEIIGHGISSGLEYPQHKEDLEGKEEDELLELKEKYEVDSEFVTVLFKESTKPVLFISHNVPFNTPIDKIVNPDSPRNGYHYGSLIARESIDEFQPLVCIGGHMHEHFTSCKVGNTIAINAGFGSEVNVFLEVVGDNIKKLEFNK
jgi:Icc-related predicted phosphoesterase